YAAPSMPRGTVELEPEVANWIERLGPTDFGRAEFYVDLLADRGPLLDQPYTRQLRGKLRELRFYRFNHAVRISYFIASNRRIILLTVFHKQRRKERAEIDHAYKVMQRCIEEKHVAPTESDEET